MKKDVQKTSGQIYVEGPVLVGSQLSHFTFTFIGRCTPLSHCKLTRLFLIQRPTQQEDRNEGEVIIMVRAFKATDTLCSRQVLLVFCPGPVSPYLSLSLALECKRHRPPPF